MKEIGNGSSADAGLTGEEVVMPGMEFMMQCYEHELKHPIKNLVSGQLARSLLIQVGRTATTTSIHLRILRMSQWWLQRCNRRELQQFQAVTCVLEMALG